MMRRLGLLAAGALVGAAAAGGIAQFGAVEHATAAGSETYRQLNLFGEALERIRADYVEEPDEQKLIEAAINGMLSSLDPHSNFLNAKDFKDMQEQTQGEFYGLGIEVTMENDLIKVITPIDDTPAARAGIIAGDVVTHLDGEQVQGLTLQQAVEKMRGPANTSIVLTVVREGADKPLEIKVTRDVIRVQSVRHRVEDDIGYIRLTQFSAQTADGVEDAIDKIKAEIPADKLKGYVVDLRNNGGGLLDQAISVSDMFLDKGEIVSTRGRDPEDVQRSNARSGDRADGKPLVVLINAGSASASEIVAGALQDHRRATLLGTRSFGKGSVQTIIPLARDEAIKLTTARYYTPSGRSIQAKGIEPDVEVIQELPDDLKGKLQIQSEANLRGHLLGEGEGADKDASAVPGTDMDEEAATPETTEENTASAAYVPSDPKDDKQLNYAYDLLRGIQVNSRFPANPSQGIPN